MAVLTDPDRAALHAELMQLASAANLSLTILKSALRDAVNATDDWIDANAASFNNALPVAVRNALTAKQKAQLFMLVARRRFEVA